MKWLGRCFQRGNGWRQSRGKSTSGLGRALATVAVIIGYMLLGLGALAHHLQLEEKKEKAKQRLTQACASKAKTAGLKQFGVFTSSANECKKPEVMNKQPPCGKTELVK